MRKFTYLQIIFCGVMLIIFISLISFTVFADTPQGLVRPKVKTEKTKQKNPASNTTPNKQKQNVKPKTKEPQKPKPAEKKTAQKTTCSVCKKPIKQCEYQGNHPDFNETKLKADQGDAEAQGRVPRQKCKVCGKYLKDCKGQHTPTPPPQPKTCSVCGKTVGKCQYGGNHPKCKTCHQLKEVCQYKGNHPSTTPSPPPPPKLCSVCKMTVDKCKYGGNHPKCKTCHQLKEVCQYKGNHPSTTPPPPPPKLCSVCKMTVDKCKYSFNHPKCQTCGELLESCQYDGDHSDFNVTKISALNGNAEDQYNLAWYYYNGNRVNQDQAEAVRWFREAAEQGHATAKVRLEELEKLGYK